MGWKKSKDFFEEVFNRDLDDYNDPIRTNQLNFNKTWPLYSLNAQLRYDLDSTIRNTHNPDVTLQQLPVIEFDGVKQRISTSPFFYNLNSQYVYFWSQDSKRTQRLDAYPRLYLPFQLRPFINIEPSVGVRGTLWCPDKKEFGPDDKNFYHRELYDTRLDLFSELYSVFHTESKTIEAIKHTIRPRIIHDFIPDVDQDDLPNFDSIDRIDNINLLTYSLTNVLTSKTRKTGSFDISHRLDPTRATIIDSAADYSYNDFLRFELEQSYDFNEGQRKRGGSSVFSPRCQTGPDSRKVYCSGGRLRCGPSMIINFYPTTSKQISGTFGETDCIWNTGTPGIPTRSVRIRPNPLPRIYV